MGTVNYKLRKSVAPMGMIKSEDQIGINLNDIAYLLSQMPSHTTIKSINQAPITDLSIQFDVELSNPIFKDGMELKEDFSQWIRDIGFDSRGGYQQFNRSTLFNLDEVVRKGDEVVLEEEENEN